MEFAYLSAAIPHLLRYNPVLITFVLLEIAEDHLRIILEVIEPGLVIEDI